MSNMTRTWDTSAKQYLRTAGLVCVHFYSTNDKKAHIFTLKALLLSACTLSAARGTSSYKSKNELFLHYKIALPCCGDREPPCNVGRSHSPIFLKPLEADGRGGIMVSVFFLDVCCLLFVVLCTKCCWNLGCRTVGLMGWNKLSYIGFSIKKKMADLNTCTYLGFSIKKNTKIWRSC